MSVIDTLVYDRTEGDVTRVATLRKKILSRTATDEEKQEWLRGMKGAYNASDMNRVTVAMKVLAERLSSDGYDIQFVDEELPPWLTPVAFIESDGSHGIDTAYSVKTEQMKVRMRFRYTSDRLVKFCVEFFYRSFCFLRNC